MGLTVALTKFTAPKSAVVCKRMDLAPDGKVIKTLGGKFFNGEFNTLIVDWNDFGTVLSEVGLNECLCLGTSSMKDRVGQLITSGACGADAVRRTKQNFGWKAKDHGADAHPVLLDIDEIPPGCRTVEDIVARVLDDVPELNQINTGFWAYPSAGAFIYDEAGNQKVGLSGVHIYFALPVEYDVDIFRHYLRHWLICQNNFFIKENRNCYLRAATYIDSSAIGQERADYIGGSDCGPGLVQRRGAPEFFESEGRGELLLGESDKWSTAKAQQLVDLAINQYMQDPAYIERRNAYVEGSLPEWGCKPREGIELVRNLQHGVVRGSMTLHFDSGARPQAWEVLLNPDQYDGLTLADPRDDKNTKGKAKFFANSQGKYAGRPMIHGFKGGDMFFDVQVDMASVRRIYNNNETAAKVSELHGADWWRIISENSGLNGAEVEEVLGELQIKWREKRTDMRKRIMAALLANDKRKTGSTLKDRIASYNSQYACVRVGDDVRIVFDEYEDEFFNAEVSVEMTKNGFFDWMAEDQVWDINDKGKTVSVEVARRWWENPGRRKYSGTTFAPWTRERDVNGKLNMYRGFSIDAVPMSHRACQGQGCQGKGCLHWFLNVGIRLINPESDPCSAVSNDWKEWGCGFGPEVGEGKPYSGCTWWYRTLYENLCGYDKGLFQWSLDWIADMFQNPADRKKSAFVMQGPQGIGKGLLVKPLAKIYKQHFYQAKSRREVTGRFNLHLQHLILLFVDEASWGGDIEAAGIWKTFVSEEVMNIEKKGRDIKVGRNFARVMVASNNSWVVAADMDDRRYFVLTGSPKYQNRDPSSGATLNASRGLEEYWRRVATVKEGELLDELLKLEVTSNLAVAPVTEGLLAQKRQTMGVMEQFVQTLLEGYPHAFGRPISGKHLYQLLLQERLAPPHYSQNKLTLDITRFLVAAGCARREANVSDRLPDGSTVARANGYFLDREKVSEWFYGIFGEG